MGQLRVGGPVPGRKQRPNPEFITGRPQIGTFQGLGMPSTVRALRLQAKADGVRLSTGGGTGHRNLDPRNLGHRVRKNDAVKQFKRKTFDHAKVLSHILDRLERPAKGMGLSRQDIIASKAGREYRECITHLYHDAPQLFAELLRLELARGRRWAMQIPILGYAPEIKPVIAPRKPQAPYVFKPEPQKHSHIQM